MKYKTKENKSLKDTTENTTTDEEDQHLQLLDIGKMWTLPTLAAEDNTFQQDATSDGPASTQKDSILQVTIIWMKKEIIKNQPHVHSHNQKTINLNFKVQYLSGRTPNFSQT